MPLTVPPSTQYQAPLFPLRGLWNATPVEGDKFVAAEIDWGTYPPGQGVQFALSGNSPVAFSQIVALSVDNARCGSDVQFIFADSGFTLQVPSHCQGVYPVFTNGLNFYAVALNAGPADVTSFNIHNSMPPPVALQITQAQNHAISAAVPIQTNGTYPAIPAPTTGTLNGGTVVINYATGATGEYADVSLRDGAGTTVWHANVSFPVSTDGTQTFDLGQLNVRFFNGLFVVIANSQIPLGTLIANLYYSVP